MSELSFLMRFVLAVLATWRVTHLLAREDGPGDLIVRFRVRLGSGWLAGLLDCFYCVSIWVALPLALLVTRTPVDLLLTWLALSGAACLLERVGQEQVVIQPFPETTGDPTDGMLWTEASGGTDGVGGEPVEIPGQRSGGAADPEAAPIVAGDAHAGRSRAG